MKYTILILTAVVLLLLTQTSHCKSLRRKARAPQQENSYDVGLLDTCATPMLSVCSDYVDYQVPGVLAETRQVAIKEAVIMAAYNITAKTLQQNGYNSTLCAQAFLELECRNQFPRCEQDSQGVRSVKFSDHQDCAKLRTQCSPNLVERFKREGYCSLNDTVPLGQCKRTSEYSGYQFCNTTIDAIGGWQDWYITDWMHLYLQRIEQQISEFIGSGFNPTSKCVKQFIKFSCSTVGRCWDQGRKTELIASRVDCNDLVKCFQPYLTATFNEILQCDQWPLEADKPSSTSTPITTNPTQATEPTRPPVTPAGHVTFPTSARVSSAPSALHGMIITQLTLVLTLVALVVSVQIT